MSMVEDIRSSISIYSTAAAWFSEGRNHRFTNSYQRPGNTWHSVDKGPDSDNRSATCVAARVFWGASPNRFSFISFRVFLLSPFLFVFVSHTSLFLVLLVFVFLEMKESELE